MIHVFPTCLDLDDLDHSAAEFAIRPEELSSYVRHLRERGCALCDAGECWQQVIYDYADQSEPVVVHGCIPQCKRN